MLLVVLKINNFYFFTRFRLRKTFLSFSFWSLLPHLNFYFFCSIFLYIYIYIYMCHVVMSLSKWFTVSSCSIYELFSLICWLQILNSHALFDASLINFALINFAFPMRIWCERIAFVFLLNIKKTVESKFKLQNEMNNNFTVGWNSSHLVNLFKLEENRHKIRVLL